MSSACSTCLESFTPKSDVSTTPCGHVFHTDCIEKWLKNGCNSCSQCPKQFRRSQIIKLYFSESQLEDNLNMELEEAQQTANERSLKFQKENLELREENQKANERSLRFQKQNTKMVF